MPNLLKHWDAAIRGIKRNHRVALFLDFDGTLVKIAKRPRNVQLTPAARHILKKLSEHAGVKVTVISGRRRAELLRHIALKNICYLGLYGWETDTRTKLSSAASGALLEAHAVLSNAFSFVPHVWIESKKDSFSVHLLGAKPAVQRRIRRQIRAAMKPLRNNLQIFENLRDVEIVPLAVEGKGSAVKKTLERSELRNAFPIYFGDDYSDEPAFDAVRNGLGVLVGPQRPTLARFLLRDPAQVTTALTRLEASLA